MPATCGGRFEQVQTLIIMSCIDGCTHVCIYAELSRHIKRTGVLPLWSVKNCRREDSGWVNYFDKNALKWVEGKPSTLWWVSLNQLMHLSFIYLFMDRVRSQS